MPQMPFNEKDVLGMAALRDPEDNRDKVFRGATTPPDWEKGYDVRNVLGDDLPLVNQGGQLSCVGHATATYGLVLQIFELMDKYGMTYPQLKKYHALEVEMISARAIYSLGFLPNGGMYLRDAMKIAKDTGFVFERYAPTYKNGQPVSEEEARNRAWMTPEALEVANKLKAKEYQVIPGQNMSTFAEAIQGNLGVLSGLEGVYNGTWFSQRPKPPAYRTVTDQGKEYNVPISVDFGHGLYFAAYGTDSMGRFVASPNSWGMRFGDEEKWYPGAPAGFGMQKFYQDHFTSGAMFNPWTLTDKSNQSDMIQLIKGDKREMIYAMGGDGLLNQVPSMPMIAKGDRKKYWRSADMIIRPQAEVDAMPKEDLPIIF